eukprot:CAMPEP_0115566320 /NCGR_PEP_ID=MMETSP0271-20121206/103524_1 /TAXON_ID=71861 /ORGANISM="Scrippsiella trochoidea, Strain CCMP3099" /LENGTH=135 /DNA_ID=CAMNT_0003000625 /DNA_START=805 /DNA_END=1212 /DNA_ORIENTATION=-
MTIPFPDLCVNLEFELLVPGHMEGILAEIPPNFTQLDDKCDCQAVENDIRDTVAVKDQADGVSANNISDEELHAQSEEREGSLTSSTLQEICNPCAKSSARNSISSKCYLYPSKRVQHQEQQTHCVQEIVEIHQV